MKKNRFASVLVLTAAGSFAIGPVWADVKSDQAIAKAEEQFAKGKPDEAIKSLEKLASGSPSVEAYLALGHLQELNGNADAAAASVAKAVELSASATSGQKAQALAASARMALKGGSGKSALDQATKAVAADKNAHSLGTLASAHARVGDAKSAHAAADAAIAAGATSSTAHAGKGDALSVSGQHADAIASYKKAIEFDKTNTAAKVGLTYALVAANKATEAKAVALEATTSDKNSGAAFAALGYAISAEKNFSGTDASWGDAIAQAQQGAFLAPKDPKVHVIVAKLFEARGNYDQALASYNLALTIDPGYTEARTAIITTQFRKGDLDGALVAARELVKQNPESPEANKMYGEFLARKGQYKEAVPPLEKAVAAMPRAGDAYAMLAHSYHMTRSFEDAKDAYAKAVELNPTDIGIKSNYGLLLGMSGDTDKGAQVLAALVATPGYKSAAGYANYGWVLSRMKPPKGPEAIAAYRKAIELDPANGGLHFGLGWAMVFAGQFQEAITEFDRAATMDKTLFADTRHGITRANYRLAVANSTSTSTPPDFAKAKAAEAAAEAAGRPDVVVAEAIANYEKQVASGEAAAAADAARRAAANAGGGDDSVDVGKLSKQLQKGSVSQRVDAANALAGAGSDAAEVLGYAIETDSTIVVRQAAVNSLRKIGGGARRALPYLRRYVNSQPTAQITAGKDEIALEMMESDLRKVIADLIRRLG